MKPHAGRRAEALAAASATSIVPINSRKRKEVHRAPLHKCSRALPDAAGAGSVATTPQHPPQHPPSADVEDPVDDAAVRVDAPPTRATAGANLLQGGSGLDQDETCGEEERLLTEFVQLHPVLSLNAASQQTLQLLANLTDKTPIKTKELEIVGKSWDDAMLRPPHLDQGERACILGTRCICVWLARWRYGDNTDLAFVCREFLTPNQADNFKRCGKLPINGGKCLVCHRYTTTYIYRCARSDPTFSADAQIPLQAFGNALGCETGAGIPHAVSVADDADGYRRSAMLFVDEQWSNTSAARRSMSTLLWRPVVKFCSTHYRYTKDSTGVPRILQVGVCSESWKTRVQLPPFREPAGSL